MEPPQSFRPGTYKDRASGQSLIQELRHSTRLPIIPIKVDTDKLARAQSVTPLIEAGRVLLPESAPWLNDFVDELAAFPKGTHDDCVRLHDLGAELYSTPNDAHGDFLYGLFVATTDDMMSQASGWLLLASIPTVTFSTVYLKSSDQPA